MDSRDMGTRARVLAAAEAVFSERGFEGATVREIVARAGVNIASVNYHYGGKSALYEASLQSALDRFGNRFDATWNDARSRSDAWEQLRLFLKKTILLGLTSQQITAPEKLLGWEILSPTDQASDIIKRRCLDRVDEMEALLCDLNVAPDDELERRTLALWLMGQAIWFSTLAPHLIQAGDMDEANRVAENIAGKLMNGLVSTIDEKQPASI